MDVLNRLRKNISSRAHTLRGLAVLFALLLAVIAIGLFIFVIYLRLTLPDPKTVATRHVQESTKIYDRTGEILLYDIYNEERRTVIPADQIPDTIKKATIAAEDARFYEHRGFDLRGIARAVFRGISSGGIEGGGSTITQQLVKKALFGDQQTIARKLREIMLAIEIERAFSKDEILSMYLNQIPYGSNAYGIESASRTFFKKPAKDLTLAQAATLAALPNRPSYLSPFGSHLNELTSRKNYILERMHDLDLITDTEYAVSQTEVVLFGQEPSKLGAPHFVIMAKEYVTEKYGEAFVEGSGLKIITTLDADLQTSAEDIIAKYAKINKERYKASNAALVSIDPKTGDVLALVGSADYFDTSNEGNFNVALANRQPGSAFKPFAYAELFNKGYPDTTILFDVKTEFNPLCSPDGNQSKDVYGQDCYHPKNYDGQYRGPVTLRQSLSQSLNIPSVKTLYLAGVQTVADTAERMGITTLGDRSRFGLSLVLGGAEVKLVDLTSAYGVFANDGVRNPWEFIQRIERADGTVLEERVKNDSRAIDSGVARMISSVLSDNSARTPVFGPSSALYFPGREVAAKTGTTQENRDAWVVGYTPSIVTGVWVGNNRNQSMTAAGAGISAAGPLWHEFMTKALLKVPQESFPQPEPSSSSKPMLNGSYVYTSPITSMNEVHSILYFVDREDPTGQIPQDPSKDQQFTNWEWAVKSVIPTPQ